MTSSSQPRILVVDDNRLVQEMVRDAFREAGFAVEVAAEVEEEEVMASSEEGWE